MVLTFLPVGHCDVSNILEMLRLWIGECRAWKHSNNEWHVWVIWCIGKRKKENTKYFSFVYIYPRMRRILQMPPSLDDRINTKVLNRYTHHLIPRSGNPNSLHKEDTLKEIDTMNINTKWKVRFEVITCDGYCCKLDLRLGHYRQLVNRR